MPSVDLTQLPAPKVIEEIDYETLLQQRKNRLITAVPADIRDQVAATLALETEPLTILLQENSYTEMILRQRINEAAKAVTLAYSLDSDLDVVAANLDTERKIIQPADPDAVPPVPEVRESNDEFRTRAQMAFEGLSVAGPRGAYEFHALSADPRVADVKAVSPAPCEVVVTVLARAGDGAAPADLVTVVATALDDEDIRPVGDFVTVQSAAIVPYVIEATLFFFPGPEAEPIRAAAEASLRDFISKQRRIGRDIRRSAIYAALHVEGIQRVELAKPSQDIVITTSQAGHCTGYTLTMGGADE